MTLGLLAMVLLGGVLAYRWAGALPLPWLSRVVAAALMGLALLLVPMQLLGLAALITRQPLVTVWGASSLLAAVLALDLIGFRRRALDWRMPVLPVRELGWGELACLGLTVVALGWALAFGLAHPPVGWDNQHYHLPRAINFLQRHTLVEYWPPQGYTLGHVENALGYNACHAYPGNWSLYLSLLALPRVECLLTIAQFPFLLLGGLVAYRLSRRLGANRLGATIGLACATTAPLALNQGIVPYADVFCGTLILASVLFLLEAPASGGTLAMAGLALGLALGAKSTSLIYGLLIGVAVVAVLLVKGRRRSGLAPWQVLLFGLIALVPSAYWFGENWFLYGSPVVPFQLKLAGVTLFPGKDPALFDSAQEWVYVNRRSEWLTYPWTEKFNFESGFGMLWTTLLPLAWFGLLPVLRKGHDGDRRLGLAVIGFMVAGSMLVWWKLTHHEPRYMMHVVGLVAVLAACGFSRLRGKARIAATALALVALVGNGAMAWKGIHLRHTDGWTRNDYVGAISRTPRELLDTLDAMPAAHLFNEKHGLVESTTVAYALYGSRYQHRLLEDQNLQSGSVSEFRRNLLAQGVDHLFVIARSDDSYLDRYTPANGFERCLLIDRDGLKQALYKIAGR